ncbi:hypothetical protein OG21DRAFT_148452 [Imleria badia]|nr:hypothetical protein OG21DRAFT_148452 [Imleria badia]
MVMHSQIVVHLNRHWTNCHAVITVCGPTTLSIQLLRIVHPRVEGEHQYHDACRLPTSPAQYFHLLCRQMKKNYHRLLTVTAPMELTLFHLETESRSPNPPQPASGVVSRNVSTSR